MAILGCANNKKKLPNNGLINLRTLGAKGNGVDDDTAIILAAIDQLTPNGTLYFPQGTYLVRGSKDRDAIFELVDKQNLVIKGVPGKSTLLIQSTGSSNGSVVFRVRSGNHITFAGLSIRAKNKLSASRMMSAGVAENSTFYNPHVAIQFLGKYSSIRISGCSFMDFTGAMVHFAGTGRNISLFGNNFSNGIRFVPKKKHQYPQPTGILMNGESKEGVYVKQCDFLNFIDCSGQNSKANGLYLSHVKDVEIEGCSFKVTNKFKPFNHDNGGIQVYFQESSNIQISKCHFNNVSNDLYAANNIVFKGNELIDARLTVATSNSTIQDNTFQINFSGKGYGILRTNGNVKDLKIQGNKFTDYCASDKANQNIALQIYGDAQNFLIKKNTFSDYYTSILLGKNQNQDISKGTVENNEIILGTKNVYGIRLISGYDNIIVDNKVVSKQNARKKAQSFQLLSKESKNVPKK